MKILIINPNTSTEMWKTIDSMAKKYASHETEITTVNPPDGPTFIANANDSAIQIPKVIDIVEKNKGSYDYFILACGHDPGLDACRVVVSNIIGIGEASIMTACAVAKRFSFLSSTVESAAAVPDKLRSLGIDPSRFASARPVGTSDEIVKKRYEMFDVYCQAGQKCIEEDGAGAIILSCAGMSDIKERLEQYLKIPVIAGVISALKIVEQFSGVPHL
ncbi:aspartate/glutamate racemase family protein [Chloroflexota bacterium]